MPYAVRHTMRTWHLLGGATVVGVLVVLALMAVGVARYPASIQGPGNRLLWINVMVLVMYGLAAIWVWHQRHAKVRSAISIGATTGLLLGAVYVANHVIELFVPARNFALVISPVFLMFALLGAVGSAALATHALGCASGGRWGVVRSRSDSDSDFRCAGLRCRLRGARGTAAERTICRKWFERSRRVPGEEFT